MIEVVSHTIVQLLRKAKVYQLDVALGVKEDVLRLQISVCHTLTTV